MKCAMVAVWLLGCGAAMTPETSARPAASPEVTAAAMIDAFTNGSPRLTPDGQVVFVSNREGMPILYVADVAHPSAPPRKLPTHQRALSPSLTPDGKTIVYLSDVGANQIFHVFSIGLDGSHDVDLTPSDDFRRGSLHVARRSGTMFWTGHTLQDQSTHVFMRTVDGEQHEIYVDPRPGSILDVTPDGASLLFESTISDTNRFLMIIDTEHRNATGAMFGRDQELNLSDASFVDDGKDFIFATEMPDRPTQITRAKITGEITAQYDEPTARTASTSSIVVSPKGDRLVALLDAGDHNELRVLDAKTLRPLAQPDLPLASFDIGQFSSDGSILALTERGARAPADIVALDLATNRLVPLRNEPRSGLGTPPLASIERLRTFDGLTLPVNLYRSPGPVSPRPVLVLVHGGPSGSAVISWSLTVAFWTAMGFVVVAPNIRGSTGFGVAYQTADDREHRADALHDMETINTWIRAQPWCDPKRIVIGGISYGGYMTLLALARQPTLWAAGIDGSGMSNLVTMEQLEDQAIRQFDDTEFGKLGVDDALLREWSPITHAANIVAPVFVYQGANDPVTPQHEADQIVEALTARHVPVEYMLVRNEGHGVSRRENLIAYLARSYRFLAAHLGL